MHLKDMIANSPTEPIAHRNGISALAAIDKLSSLHCCRGRFPNLPLLTSHAMLKCQNKGSAWPGRPCASGCKSLAKKAGVGWVVSERLSDEIQAYRRTALCCLGLGYRSVPGCRAGHGQDR